MASFARAITRYRPTLKPRLRALKDTELAPVLPLRVSVVPSLEYRTLRPRALRSKARVTVAASLRRKLILVP